MAQDKEHKSEIFVSLEQLLEKERLASFFSSQPRRKSVNTVAVGKHRSALRGRGFDFEEVRQYVKGDDIRNIDWKVTARTQKTHTRVFTEEKEKPTLIVVDQTKSMFFGSVKYTKSVIAAELAAMMAFSVLKEGDLVGGIILSDEGTDVLLPKRGRKNILQFLKKLTQCNQGLENSAPISFENVTEDALRQVNNIVSHDFTVVIIGHFQHYSPKIIKYITQLSAHNDVILMKVYDPMEQVLPKVKFIAGNRTHQIAVNGKDKHISDVYSDGFTRDFSQFQEEMRKHRVPIYTFSTAEDLFSK
ncbi:MAG: DUF58 domain-containing protein [Bacteroidales bacterium]